MFHRKLSDAARRHNQRLEEECERVPVLPFRERFLYLSKRGEMNTADLCYSIGWVYRPTPERARAERRRPGCVKPDTSHARRVLGIGCHGKDYVTYDVALKLANALGLDPHEAGI